MAWVIKTGKWGRARKIIPLLLFDSTRKILCQHIKEVTGDHKLHSLFETWVGGVAGSTTSVYKLLKLWQVLLKVWSRIHLERVGKNKTEGLFWGLNTATPLMELRRRQQTVVITRAYKSKSISLSHTPCFICSPPTPPVPPHLTGLGLDSEWVTLLFTIFQIPSQVFALAGCPAFSLAITGLRGFSNGAFEEITLFSPSSREKMETFGQQLIQSITQTKLELCLTHLATKMSSYLVWVETYRRAHMPFDAQFRVSQKLCVTNELLWNEKIWCKSWELL